MTRDLTKLLADWPFHPDEVRVRFVEGADGRPYMQFRVELGLLQMELDGRPDGERPEGFDSWLDYFEDRAARSEEPLKLDDNDCHRLLREGIQFYHRYLGFWYLEQYDRCVRDTARNLRLFAFVRAHAQDAKQTLQFDQWRPYVLMMRARALGTPLEKAGRIPEALAAVDQGIAAIREFLEEYGQLDQADHCGELTGLLQWREALLDPSRSSPPLTPRDLLRHQLDEAIRREDFEEAARLRDQLRAEGEPRGGPPPHRA